MTYPAEAWLCAQISSLPSSLHPQYSKELSIINPCLFILKPMHSTLQGQIPVSNICNLFPAVDCGYKIPSANDLSNPPKISPL